MACSRRSRRSCIIEGTGVTGVSSPRVLVAKANPPVRFQPKNRRPAHFLTSATYFADSVLLLNYRRGPSRGQPLRCCDVYNATPSASRTMPCTCSSRSGGRASPSRCKNSGLPRRSCTGKPAHATTLFAACNGCRRTKADARSICSLADSLKSAFDGSRTIRYSNGFRNCSSVLLSRITCPGRPRSSPPNSCSALRNNGIPSARNPCLVLNQKERRAPAAKKRPLSVSLARFSQLIAQTCSSGAQSQFSPFCAQTPWPYCVIFPAIQFSFGSAAIKSHTNCVFPILRVCPPTTITCHRMNLIFPFFSVRSVLVVVKSFSPLSAASCFLSL